MNVNGANIVDECMSGGNIVCNIDDYEFQGRSTEIHR